MTRGGAAGAFLAAHGFGAAAAAPLAQDASFRRYLRLTGGPRPAVLMQDAPAELPAFLRAARHLASIGLSAPEIIAADEAAGLLLLEDLGDALLHALPPEALPDAYDAAVDALLAMQEAAAPAGLPAWGAREMRDGALATFLGWWWPAAFGAPAPEAARAELEDALDRTLAPLDDGPRVFVHRDYFAGNLIFLPGREGARRVGIIDFQLGSAGHPAYDLASLTQDSRRALDPAVAARAERRFLAARGIDPARVAICAAQRHMRVAGLWRRLAARDGKPQYLAYAPHTWRLLEAALTHPANHALAAAFDRLVPARVRPA